MAELVAIKDITIEEGLHCRNSLNMDAISRYSEILDDLPPVKLVRVGDTLLLASGHHRYESYVKAGRNEIPAEVTVGTRLDAIKIGLKDNLQHGVPLSRNERNRAIVMLVEENLLYREIGEIFGLGDDAVGLIALKAGRRRRDASINEKGKRTREAEGQDPISSGPTTTEETLEPGESIPAMQDPTVHQPDRQETAATGTAVDADSTPEHASHAHPTLPQGGANLADDTEYVSVRGRVDEWAELLVVLEHSGGELCYPEEHPLAEAAYQRIKEVLSGLNLGYPYQ